MNRVAKKILKSLLLSATVALANSANAKKTDLPESLTLGLSSDNPEFKEADSKQKIVRDVYKILKNGNAKLIAGHRSHSSHRSHRSSSGGHYSHSSSSYSSGLSSGGSSYSSSAGSGSSSSHVKKKYNLGERKLSVDMSGNDVTQLVELLRKAGFPPNENVLHYKNEEGYVFSEDITMAIKVFQAFHGIKPTGDLDSKTITELKKYDK
jgi:hypothetical protein